jgi:hypothetical protein
MNWLRRREVSPQMMRPLGGVSRIYECHGTRDLLVYEDD